MAKKKVLKTKNKNKTSSVPKGLPWSLLGAFVFFLAIFFLFKITFHSNIEFRGEKRYFLVQSPASIHDISDTLEKHGIIKSSFLLRLMAELKGYNKVRKGLFEFKNGWSNYSIIKHLEEDSLKPYIIARVPAYKLRKNVVESVCDYFPEIQKAEIWRLLRDKSFLDSLGFSKENVFSIFIPGKYPLPRNLSPRELLEAMHQEYLFFWNTDRLAKCEELELSPQEVTILASIVYSETKLKNEMPKIAGVYLNRLKKEMRLQSDPTVIYAAHKYGARRVYFKDRKINSKYNTYRYHGLPPGPIHITPVEAIDAVLNFESHDYLYFCAKADMSGCHVFTKSFKKHKTNADKYRKALDDAGIR